MLTVFSEIVVGSSNIMPGSISVALQEDTQIVDQPWFPFATLMAGFVLASVLQLITEIYRDNRAVKRERRQSSEKARNEEYNASRNALLEIQEAVARVMYCAFADDPAEKLLALTNLSMLAERSTDDELRGAVGRLVKTVAPDLNRQNGSPSAPNCASGRTP